MEVEPEEAEEATDRQSETSAGEEEAKGNPEDDGSDSDDDDAVEIVPQKRKRMASRSRFRGLRCCYFLLYFSFC